MFKAFWYVHLQTLQIQEDVSATTKLHPDVILLLQHDDAEPKLL